MCSLSTVSASTYLQYKTFICTSHRITMQRKIQSRDKMLKSRIDKELTYNTEYEAYIQVINSYIHNTCSYLDKSIFTIRNNMYKSRQYNTKHLLSSLLISPMSYLQCIQLIYTTHNDLDKKHIDNAKHKE